MQPLVSILIPTYNRPDYLYRALASAVAQSYGNIEILVGDNSILPGENERMIQLFNDPRIIHIVHGQNLGMVQNVLALMRLSSGKYMSFLHDDDIWYPKFIEKMIEILENDSEINLSFCNFDIIDNSGKKNERVTDIELERLNRNLLEHGIQKNSIEIALIRRSIVACTSTVLRRSSVNLDHFLVDTNHAYDIWISYLALINGGYAYFSPETLGFYRIHANSNTTVKFIDSNLSMIYCYRNLLNESKLSKYFDYFKMEITMHSARSFLLIIRKFQLNLLKHLQGNLYVDSLGKIFISILVSFIPEKMIKTRWRRGAIWDYTWKIRNYRKHKLDLFKLTVLGKNIGKVKMELNH
jgi:glycosyltransferase involved in cell wall biosynthesis